MLKNFQRPRFFQIHREARQRRIQYFNDANQDFQRKRVGSNNFQNYDQGINRPRGHNTLGSVGSVGSFEYANFDPNQVKNFYHDPESPSRAFLLDFMSIFYLFKLWYSFMLTAYLDVPALIFPAWLVRWKVLLPLAKAAKGTVDGVCLSLKYGWAINLSGGFTHWTREYGDMFNIYPDISLNQN